MHVTIEPPDSWGPARMLLVELQRLGYQVEEHIILGRRLFVIGGQPASDRSASDTP
jgi:hypothetical protein